MKEIIIVFYLLVIFVTSMYLFEKYYVAKKTTEELVSLIPTIFIEARTNKKYLHMKKNWGNK